MTAFPGVTLVRRARLQAGFSLPELLIAVTILLIVSGTVTSGLLQIANGQRTIASRTEMHSGVRSATELLQQEVGQAGRVSLPGNPVVLSTAVAPGTAAVGVTQTINGVTAPSVSGIFVGELLTVGAGATQETVEVTNVDTAANQISVRQFPSLVAGFANAHVTDLTVAVFGGFASGIVPPSPGYPNGSSGTVLKLYGDINGDGNMVYVEYTCDTANGFLYRNVIPFDAAAKPVVTNDQVLLSNIQNNPGGTPCFTYMPSPLPVVGADTFVLDVAITLTVRSQTIDPNTNDYQKETKALLNVSPRNVFNVWQLASIGGVNTNRVQPIPQSVRALLP